jgi:glycosyltransferase involved in cell wall biosynthesis
VARGLADTLVGPGLGEVEPAEVPNLIAEHDVVLMPSEDEGFGLVAAEAIASGRWVVARSVGGLRDVISDGVNGTLVEDGDFATALAAVPDYDPTVVAATARRFDVELHRAGMAAVWRRVLAGPRSS